VSVQALDVSKPLRPYVIVSSDAFNLHPEYPRVTVCPLMRKERPGRRYETDVLVRARDSGLPKDSLIRCVEVYTILRNLLVSPVGFVPGRLMRDVDNALGVYLSLSNAFH
jgi:mRNA-degrading endonuclease toxin of MazEF toxin-antitoxin module